MTLTFVGENHDQKVSINDELVDIEALLKIVWRMRYRIFAIAFTTALLAAVYVQFAVTPLYTASSVLRLEANSKSILDLQSVVAGFSGDTMELNTEEEVLRSRSLMRDVVLALKLTEDPEFNGSLNPPSFIQTFKTETLKLQPERVEVDPEAQVEAEIQAAIDTLLKKTRVINLPSTFVFRVTATSQSPQKSAKLADAIAAQYVSNQALRKYEETEKASRWLSTRVAELKEELEDVETRLSTFSASSQVNNAQSVGAFERQLKELRARALETRASLKAAQIQRDALDAVAEQGRDAQASVADIPTLTALLPRLNSDTDGAAVTAQFDTIFNRAVARARLDAERLENQANALEASVVDLSAKIESQSGDLITLNQLTREVEASRLLYEHFLSRLKETAAQEGFQTPDSQILSAAIAPQGPSSPQKKRFVALYGIFGLMIGMIFFSFKDLARSTFRTPQALENFTGIRILGMLPTVASQGRSNILAEISGPKNSPSAEALRNIRTSVLFAQPNDEPKVISVVSSLPGEGKTTLSIGLAQQFASLGKKVLFIEGDFRKLGTNSLLGVQDRGTLSQVIAGELDISKAIVKSSWLDFDILHGALTGGNPADILSSPKFADLIETCKDTYDMIVIDTPPVLLVPDARILVRFSDRLLFVVRWDQTTKSQVSDALGMLELVGVPVSGLIFNAVKQEGPNDYYGKRYASTYFS
jgi:succinoglycan biosynthesis transport protein ExoP